MSRASFFLSASASELFELLAADRRRQILFLLRGTDSITISGGLSTRGATQAEQIGANGSQQLAAQQSSSIDSAWGHQELELRHAHLPKLEDENLIEWEPGTDTISRGAAFEEIEPALEALASNSMAFLDDLF